VASRPTTLVDLTRLGAGDVSHYLRRDTPPGTALEWLGIAASQLPDLAAQARTADDVPGRSRTQSVAIRRSLLEAALHELGGAAAIVEQARDALARRHPEAAATGDPEHYARLLEDAHGSSPRRAELMIGGYTTFLGGAIEVAGALAEAELAVARARRWEREDPARLVELHAVQLHVALSNVLGGLLACARLIAADAAHLTD
jgi:hypothetical protein